MKELSLQLCYDKIKNKKGGHIMTKINATAKDSVFRDLFKNPKYALQLYKAIHPEDTEVIESDISNVNIENMFIDQMYNDLGFMVRGKLLVMVEAQASWSINIVVRILLYLAETWHQHIVTTKQNRYGSKKLSLPEPEFYVLYTGERKTKPEWISLSKEFFEGHNKHLEVNVKMLYGDRKNDIISQYVAFTKIYNTCVKKYGKTKQVVLETIRICKDSNALKDYLGEREKEVIDIMMTLFDHETAMEAYKAEIMEEGREEGREEGKINAKKETALTLAEMGMSIEDIAKAVKVGVNLVKEWLSE